MALSGKSRRGRHITRSQYDLLFQSYYDNGSIKQAAKDACVGMDTAAKYINVGSEHFPAIRSRIERITAHVHASEEEARVKAERTMREAQVTLAEHGLEAVKKMEVVPNGTLVEKEDGSTAVEVNEETFGRIIRSFNDLATLADKLHGPREPERAAEPLTTHTTNVGIFMSPSQTNQAAQELLRTAQIKHGVTAGTAEEDAVVTVLASEACRRARDASEDDS